MSRQRIATRRYRLTLQQPLETADDIGGVSVTWSDVATLWAEVRPKTGREGLWADMPAGRLASLIVIRHRVGVRPDMRFTDGARIFDIRAVFDPDGRRRFLHCLCVEQPL